MKMQKDIFVFFGPPGSGKDSLSRLCVKRLGWQQLSTGNLCRDHIARQTALGKQIDLSIKSGKLISDSLIIDMVNNWLDTVGEGTSKVIFDGFPRTVAQAGAFHELLYQLKGIRLRLVQLTLADEEVVYRLLARSICRNNECQRVYSLHKHSHLQPRHELMCDDCESPLMRRSDDARDAILERLRIYHQHEQNVLEFYRQQGQDIATVHANVSLEDVYSKLLQVTDFETI